MLGTQEIYPEITPKREINGIDSLVEFVLWFTFLRYTFWVLRIIETGSWHDTGLQNLWDIYLLGTGSKSYWASTITNGLIPNRPGKPNKNLYYLEYDNSKLKKMYGKTLIKIQFWKSMTKRDLCTKNHDYSEQSWKEGTLLFIRTGVNVKKKIIASRASSSVFS